MPYRIGEVAERANVPEDFVRRLIDLGALPGEEAGLGIPEVRRSRLLHSWAAAGLSVETILALVGRGALSLAFLDTPVMETPERLDRPTGSSPPTAVCRWRSCRRSTRRSASPPRSQATGPVRTTPPC